MSILTSTMLRLSHLAIILAACVTASRVYSAPIILIDEDYDLLTPGSIVAGWTPIIPSLDTRTPVVQNTNFQSAPNGVSITNDFGAMRTVAPVDGIVTIEIWMNPKLGSDTNMTFGASYLIPSGVENGLGNLFRKDSANNWLYFDFALSSLVFIEPADGQGRSIKAVLNTSTGLYDLYFDGVLINTDIPFGPGGSFVGVAINSGRGGGGTTSFFDDLLVTYEPFSVPGPAAIWLVVVGVMSLARLAKTNRLQEWDHTN